MYFCRDCGRQFQSGHRIDNVCLWNDYLTEKRTISELSTLHKCSEILLSGKTFWGLSVLVKIDLNLLFLRIIGYYRSFLVKISAFYNAYSLKLKTKPLDE